MAIKPRAIGAFLRLDESNHARLYTCAHASRVAVAVFKSEGVREKGNAGYTPF